MEGDVISNSLITNSQKRKKISQSKFYDVSSSALELEKQDEMKPVDSSEEGELTREIKFYRDSFFA